MFHFVFVQKHCAAAADRASYSFLEEIAMDRVEKERSETAKGNETPGRSQQPVRVRLTGALSDGEIQTKSLRACEIATKYNTDLGSVLRLFSDLQALGMVTLQGHGSAVIRSRVPKEMQEAYEIRAALEEIGGRSAAKALAGNTNELRRELDAMQAAVRDYDLDAYVEHDVAFHRHILRTSQNELLLRIWDTLAFDLRLRAVIGKVSGDLTAVVESHQPIIDVLESGHGKEAGVLLRNHSETFLRFLQKEEQDSRLHKELELAANIQQALVPERTPSIPGLNCQIFYKPAHAVGGDYYDILPFPDGRWGIAIGDVSGKGIGAALLMASLQASLRAEIQHSPSDVALLINSVNRLAYESLPENFYATLFYAEYHPDTRKLTYVNAGHQPPIVLRQTNGSCQVHELNSSGPPVGMFADSHHTAMSFQLEVSDYLVAYTDGITETQTADYELWGHQRLANLLCSSRNHTPQQIVQQIVAEAAAFAKGGVQTDDMTLLVMQVREEAGDAELAE
jgi:serine phosphatase RsbU (regulator of sigma subunit)